MSVNQWTGHRDRYLWPGFLLEGKVIQVLCVTSNKDLGVALCLPLSGVHRALRSSPNRVHPRKPMSSLIRSSWQDSSTMDGCVRKLQKANTLTQGGGTWQESVLKERRRRRIGKAAMKRVPGHDMAIALTTSL